MNNSRKIKLDMSRLYGFKIVQAMNAEKCLTPKIGGGKPPIVSAPTLSPKIGGKAGLKPDAKR